MQKTPSSYHPGTGNAKLCFLVVRGACLLHREHRCCTSEGSICTSARRPECELRAVGEAPLSSLRLFLLVPCSASCLDETCFQDTDDESSPLKELKHPRFGHEHLSRLSVSPRGTLLVLGRWEWWGDRKSVRLNPNGKWKRHKICKDCVLYSQEVNEGVLVAAPAERAASGLQESAGPARRGARRRAVSCATLSSGLSQAGPAKSLTGHELDVARSQLSVCGSPLTVLHIFQGPGACSQVASEAGSGDVATMPKDSSATTWPPEGPALMPLGSPLSNHGSVVQTSPGHQEAGDRSHLQGGWPFLRTGLDDSWGQALCLLQGPWGRGGGGRPRAVCVQESQRPPSERLVGSGHALCRSMV
ncbi:unnamed protein product [Rangifer tarandus platyrhynchus]|uniref:Uncharacterized protein n=2 Tax=Rangifer tarandus platyrhynchus TaxID=3082113 RepID=A0ACB0EMW2_RANTA|nr:unnamed protein product [Rangifer tarandus platyrhynchus]CAI9702030.1 unnamed protein product [Rangifer tarandus platyrhynchus]